MTKHSLIQIRLATSADLPRLAALLHAAFIEYKSSYTDEGFAATTPTAEQLAKRMTEGPIWVAEENGMLHGTVSAVSRGEDLYIRGMAVLPESRGLGVGQLLLATVERFAQSHKRLTLSTTPFLINAIRLYERSGFRRTTDGPHDLFGTPLFTMVKKLD
jgi:ribosomal protein S18 acetylase RimI-like enzyme